MNNAEIEKQKEGIRSHVRLTGFLPDRLPRRGGKFFDEGFDMTDRQLLEHMTSLTKKLCDVYNVEPLDQEARQAILDEVHEISAMFNRSRRRRSFFAAAGIAFLLFLLALCIGYILF